MKSTFSSENICFCFPSPSKWKHAVTSLSHKYSSFPERPAGLGCQEKVVEHSAGGTRAAVAAVAGQWNTAVRTLTGVSAGWGGSGRGLPGGPHMARMGLGVCCPPSSSLTLHTEGPRQRACRCRESLAPARPACASCPPLSGHDALLSLTVCSSPKRR